MDLRHAPGRSRWGWVGAVPPLVPRSPTRRGVEIARKEISWWRESCFVSLVQNRQQGLRGTIDEHADTLYTDASLYPLSIHPCRVWSRVGRHAFGRGVVRVWTARFMVRVRLSGARVSRREASRERLMRVISSETGAGRSRRSDPIAPPRRDRRAPHSFPEGGLSADRPAIYHRPCCKRCRRVTQHLAPCAGCCWPIRRRARSGG